MTRPTRPTRQTRPTARLAVTAVTAALVAVLPALTGCGADAGGGERPGGTITDYGPPEAGPVLPAGAEDVVLRLDVSGGYVPVEHAFGNRPVLLVNGRGQVVEPLASDRVRPATLPLVSHEVSTVELRDLVRRAGEVGLLDAPPDYDEDAPMVSDMPSTTLTIRADGETRVHSAYALGFEEESGARAVLADFVAEAVEALSDPEAPPLDPTAVRLRATAPTGSPGDVEPWPVDAVRLAELGDCGVVTDPALARAAVRALTAADAGVAFEQDGRTWVVTGATVLPGEPDPCQDW